MQVSSTSTTKLTSLHGHCSIFHDCWLERPTSVPNYLKPEDVKEADVILINHAHFDHCEHSHSKARASTEGN
jgi:L-ascorbate metabolism protein UlaG (beta-lactamase superfamily)